MKYARTVTGWLLIGLLGGALAQGCGGSSRGNRPSGSGAAADTAGKDSGSMTVEPPGNSGNGGEPALDPLCGVAETNTCVPDMEPDTLCLEALGGSGGSGGSGGNPATAGSVGSAGRSGSSGSAHGGSPNGAGGNGAGGTSMSSGGATAHEAGGAGGESGAEGSSEGGASQGGVGAISGGGATSITPGGQAGESLGSAGQPALGAAGEPAETGTGGSVASSGRSGSAGQAAGGRAGGTATTALVSCQVIENPMHKGSPLATCRPAGTGTEGSPCFSSADCAPKLACVGDGPGQCRAYCCSGPDQCQAYTGTHCAVQPLVPDPKSTHVLEVPVCMPAVKCSLAETYPCTQGCSCPSDSACTVVADDGTTSCVPVSELPPMDEVRAGSPCPCAWGFVCSQATNTCVELCEVAAADKCTSKSGRCQASAALPAGWGTCVGVAPKSGAP
jgi:hypothetical protein